MSDNAVIAGWAASPVATRRIAAMLVHDLAAVSRHDRMESVLKIAARFHVSGSVATNARNLLMGQGIVYKSGRHYYVA